MFSALAAAASLSRVDPTAVGGDAGQQATDAPEVTQTSSGFEVQDASVESTIPKAAADPIAMDTAAGELQIIPRGVSAAASTGEAVNDGAAVVYAETGTDSDTSVVPFENGVETFTNIRSGDARENYSVSVNLPGDEELKQIDQDTVAIVDPTPNDKPSDASLPAPAQHGSVAAVEARQTSGITTPDPDPASALEAAQAAQQAGIDKPADVAATDIKEEDKPHQEQLDALVGQPPEDVGAGEPTSAEVDETLTEAAAKETDVAAKDAARSNLQASQQSAATPTQAMNANNEASAEDQPVVVVKVTAPSAVDADGEKIDTTLTADGDVITLHVDHKDQNVTYPIAADPEYELVIARWNIGWYPQLVQETYVSRWAEGFNYVGNWHPVFCAWGWVGCSGIGGGWYNANQGGRHNIAYWPAYNWGPEVVRIVVELWSAIRMG